MPVDAITTAKKRPTSVDMAATLREQITRGELRVGDRLPSFSEMRQIHGSAVATIERVYVLLEREGLVERRRGSGVYVTAPTREKTSTIGLIGTAVPHSSVNAYYAHLMDGIQGALDEHEQHLLFLGRSGRWSREALRKIDGLLIANVEQPEAILCDLPPQMPRISILANVSGVSSVVTDEYGGARQAVRHLLDLGHRRIACLLESTSMSTRLRNAGYTDTLREAGIEPDPRWKCPVQGNTVAGGNPADLYLEWGRECMRRWVRSDWRDLGCTAIFVQNDMAAAGVIQALLEAGIHVPNEVSVIAFDGTKACDLFLPRISAVEVPLAKIGAKAVETLMSQIEGGTTDVQTIMLPTSLRLAESTAPPPPAM